MFLKSAASKLVAGSLLTMLITEILQVTFTGLVADGAIERVIDKKEFNNAIPCVNNFRARDILYLHAIHDIRAAACYQFRHWSWVSGASFTDFYEAGTAFTSTAFQLGVITHGWGRHIPADHASSVQDRCSRFHLDGDIINCNP
jgi:hypothetical protein